MTRDTRPPDFVGKHRLSYRLRIDEEIGVFRIGPEMLVRRDLIALVLWMSLMWAGGVGVVYLGSGWSERQPLVIWTVACLLTTLAMVAIVSYSIGREFEEGPVFEFDRVGRIIRLPRDGIAVCLDDVAAVGLRLGPFRSDDEIDHVGELSLIMIGGETRPPALAFLLSIHQKEAIALAERVAAELGRPLRREGR